MDDEQPLTLEAVKAAVKESHSQFEPTLKRELDSLDDFEHLGHDSSPLKDAISVGTGDLLSGLQTEPRDSLGQINTRVESTANKFTDDLSPVVSAKISGAPLVPEKMDSNLLEMGDGFPDRKEADEKLDKFLQEISSPFSQPKIDPEPLIQDKYNFDNFMSSTKSFMDNERELAEPEKTTHSNNDLLDRYSDSEPDEDFKPSKYEDFPKKHELPESFGSIENLKTETFKDVTEEPMELPKKEYQPVRPTAPAPEPPRPAAPVVAELVEVEKQKVPEKIVEPPPVVEKSDPKLAETKSKVAVTDAEAIFCKMGLDAWFNPERLNPNVESLIYWRDPKKSGPVFGGVLLVLLALTYFSLISVVAYLSLIGLTGTIAFRIYKNIVQAVQKTGDGHPFKDLLEFDVALPQDKVKEISEVAVAHINAGVVELRRLFLVEDLVDSIKFGVLLWTLTYLGAWFNGMTLIILAWVALFSLPKVYETNKTQIDANLEIVRTKLADITSKVKAAIPIGKKVEEKKEQ